MCVAVSSLFLVTANSLSTTAVDQVVWVVAAYLVVRLLRSRDGRWWLGIGAAIGVGLQNKHTVLLLAAGLVVALIPARLTGWLRTLAVGGRGGRPGAVGAEPVVAGGQRLADRRDARVAAGGQRGAWPPRWRSRRCRSA